VLSDDDKAEGLKFSQGWPDGGAVYPVLDEVIERDRQLAVVFATVVAQLKFDAR
jgi:hypothetical protein